MLGKIGIIGPWACAGAKDNAVVDYVQNLQQYQENALYAAPYCLYDFESNASSKISGPSGMITSEFLLAQDPYHHIPGFPAIPQTNP